VSEEIPPLKGEGGERSEPGGVYLVNLGSLRENPTRPAFASLRRATLPFQGRDYATSPAIGRAATLSGNTFVASAVSDTRR
jgi:hypothetical protein